MVGLRFCISNKIPGDADPNDSQTKLLSSKVTEKEQDTVSEKIKYVNGDQKWGWAIE